MAGHRSNRRHIAWLLVITWGAASAQHAPRTLRDLSLVELTQQTAVTQAIDIGDAIDPRTGALSFTQEDVALPGQGPDMRIVRSFDVVSRMPHWSAHKGAFADWNLEVPRLTTQLPLHPYYLPHQSRSGEPQARWHVRGNQPEARCSAFAPAPDLPYPGVPGGAVPASEWWPGVQLVMPGSSPQHLLIRNPASSMPSAVITGAKPGFPLATRDHWRIACLDTLRNGAGEGFLAIAPDGTKYWFDWLVFEGAHKMHAWTTFIGTKSSLLVTRVEDRFGNFVTYTYAGDRLTEMRGSGGRHLRLVWNSEISESPFDPFAYVNTIIAQSRAVQGCAANCE